MSLAMEGRTYHESEDLQHGYFLQSILLILLHLESIPKRVRHPIH